MTSTRSERPAVKPLPPTPWPDAIRAVWLRAARISVPVGLLQVALNQGDHWLHGHVTGAVLAKTLLTPVVTYSVALVTAVATYRQLQPPS